MAVPGAPVSFPPLLTWLIGKAQGQNGLNSSLRERHVLASDSERSASKTRKTVTMLILVS